MCIVTIEYMYALTTYQGVRIFEIFLFLCLRLLICLHKTLSIMCSWNKILTLPIKLKSVVFRLCFTKPTRTYVTVTSVTAGFYEMTLASNL